MAKVHICCARVPSKTQSGSISRRLLSSLSLIMAPLNTDVIRLIVQAVADGVECAPTSDPPLRDGSAASTWLERAAALTRLSLVSRAWRQTAQHELSTWIYVRKDTLDVVEQAIECGTINRSAVKRVLSVGMGFKLDKVFALCTRVEAIHVQERPLHLDVLRFLVGKCFHLRAGRGARGRG